MMIGIRYIRFAFSMNLTAESFPASLMLNNAPVFGLELWRWSLAMCGLMISSSTGMPLCFRNDVRATQIQSKDGLRIITIFCSFSLQCRYSISHARSSYSTKLTHNIL